MAAPLKLFAMSGDKGKNGRPHSDVASPQERGAKRQRTRPGADGTGEKPIERREADNDGNHKNANGIEAGERRGEVVCSDGWHSVYEELLKSHPPRSRARITPDTLILASSEAELLTMVRRAVANSTEANWEALTFPAKPPRTQTIAAVVRRLNGPEAVAVLSTCAERYRLHARERALCVVWILQVIENRGSILVGRAELKEALRELLAHLEPRPQDLEHSSQVRSCLGRWQHARSLAQRHSRSRATTAAATVASRGTVSGAKAKPAVTAPQEEESTDEDEDTSEDGDEVAKGEASEDDE